MKASKIDLLSDYIIEKRSNVRVKTISDKLTGWRSMIYRIEVRYVDFLLEPTLITEIDYIEINCEQEIWIGRLIPAKIINHINDYQLFLMENEFDFSVVNEKVVKVVFDRKFENE